MININFFEKKQRNVTPFLIGFIAFFLLGALAGYFLWMTYSIEAKTERNVTQINQQADEIRVLQRVNLIGDQVTALKGQRDTLREQQFPLYELYMDVMKQLPTQETTVEYFYFTLTGTIQMDVVFNQDQDIVQMQRNLLQLPYVTSVTLETIEVSESEYLTQFNLTIDRLKVSEVLNQND